MNRIKLYDIFIVYILFTRIIIMKFIMSFILFFKSRLIFINSENVCLFVKSIFEIFSDSVIIVSMFYLKNSIYLLLLLSKLLFNSEMYVLYIYIYIYIYIQTLLYYI